MLSGRNARPLMLATAGAGLLMLGLLTLARIAPAAARAAPSAFAPSALPAGLVWVARTRGRLRRVRRPPDSASPWAERFRVGSATDTGQSDMALAIRPLSCAVRC